MTMDRCFRKTDDLPEDRKTFVIETGWLNFSDAYLKFQRVREFTLLAIFEGLTNLTFKMSYDFIEGRQEFYPYELPPITQMIGGETVRRNDKKEWRVQQRVQQCSSIKIRIEAQAKSAKFDSLRFGIDAGRGITGASHNVGGAPPGG